MGFTLSSSHFPFLFLCATKLLHKRMNFDLSSSGINNIQQQSRGDGEEAGGVVATAHGTQRRQSSAGTP
jgi:hypothetical protein